MPLKHFTRLVHLYSWSSETLQLLSVSAYCLFLLVYIRIQACYMGVTCHVPRSTYSYNRLLQHSIFYQMELQRKGSFLLKGN